MGGSPLGSPNSRSLMGRTASAPAFVPPVSPFASRLVSPQQTRSGSFVNRESRKVCEELDDFETKARLSESTQERPRIRNFYGPPQKSTHVDETMQSRAKIIDKIIGQGDSSKQSSKKRAHLYRDPSL